jgi:hypothetical protein
MLVEIMYVANEPLTSRSVAELELSEGAIADLVPVFEVLRVLRLANKQAIQRLVSLRCMFSRQDSRSLVRSRIGFHSRLRYHAERSTADRGSDLRAGLSHICTVL